MASSVPLSKDQKGPGESDFYVFWVGFMGIWALT